MATSNDDIISWVKTYTKDLFAFSMVKVQQKELAEDLVQETFLAAHKSFDSYKEKSTVKTWLFSILKHKIADYYRLKYKAGVEVPSGVIDQFFDANERWKPEYRPVEWSNEQELLNDPGFANALKNCFAKLPEKWSSAVRLKYLEEQDADGICNQLEISKPNYWQIIHRAKLQLRNCLELKWFKR